MRMRLDAVGIGGEGSGWFGELSMMSREAMLGFRTSRVL